jgi:hypothetical protein
MDGDGCMEDILETFGLIPFLQDIMIKPHQNLINYQLLMQTLFVMLDLA